MFPSCTAHQLGMLSSRSVTKIQTGVMRNRDKRRFP
jgi:hypothetical protein